MFYTLLRLFTIYYMLPFPEKRYYCISRSNHGLQQDIHVRFNSMQVFCLKQLASDAKILRVIWREDHMSMDDTYWQDDKEYAGGEHGA